VRATPASPLISSRFSLGESVGGGQDSGSPLFTRRGDEEDGGLSDFGCCWLDSRMGRVEASLRGCIHGCARFVAVSKGDLLEYVMGLGPLVLGFA
jgi:hypothetical protein